MNAARLTLSKMIEQLPDDSLTDIISYISFIQKSKKKIIINDLEEASISSTDFWDNVIDDEIWNNV